MIDIDNILAKHFSKQTSVEEERVLAEWIEAHQEEYAQLKSLMDATHLKDYSDKFDVADGWHDFVANKDLSLREEKNRKGRFSLSGWRIAASIIVLIGLGALYHLFENRDRMVVANEMMEVVLNDGTVVTLNRNATLSYPSKFASNKREVTLKGEAFFSVAKDKQRPFTISVDGTKVTVLGTSFNIHSTGDHHVEVVVNTGKVSFSDSKGRQVILTPGEKGVYQSKQLTKQKNDDSNFMSWKTRVLRFDDASLSYIFDTLAKVHHKKIIQKQDWSGHKATIEFNQQSLEESLNELQLLFNFKVINYKDSLIIDENKQKSS